MSDQETLAALEAAIADALHLHRQTGMGYCTTCLGQRYPCPTRKALTGD